MLLVIKSINKKDYYTKTIKMLVEKVSIFDDELELKDVNSIFDAYVILNEFKDFIIDSYITQDYSKFIFNKNISILIRKENKKDGEIFID